MQISFWGLAINNSESTIRNQHWNQSNASKPIQTDINRKNRSIYVGIQGNSQYIQVKWSSLSNVQRTHCVHFLHSTVSDRCMPCEPFQMFNIHSIRWQSNRKSKPRLHAVWWLSDKYWTFSGWKWEYWVD